LLTSVLENKWSYFTVTGKPEEQQFTIASGVMTSIGSRQRSAICGRPLSERTDFEPAQSAARQIHMCLLRRNKNIRISHCI